MVLCPVAVLYVPGLLAEFSVRTVDYGPSFLPSIYGPRASRLQISGPQGQVQRMYYRQGRGHHFLNFHAVVDNDGYFQLL